MDGKKVLKALVIFSLLASLVLITSLPNVAQAFFWNKPKTPPGNQPVLLVHGYMDTCDTPWWSVLENYLYDVGYAKSDVYTINLGFLPGTTVLSPKDYAKKLASKVEEINRATGKKVDIIAHSMGGLDARWYIEKMGGASLVDDLITLATPHQGTEVAWLGALTPGGSDMVPGSQLLTELNDGSLAEGVEYTALWGGLDECYISKWRAKIPDAELRSVSNARNIFAGWVFHVQEVWDRNVFNLYYKYLD